MRQAMRTALLMALCVLALAACSPGQAVGVLRQEAQSQNDQSEPDVTPNPPNAPGQSSDASEQGMIQVVIARGNFQQEQAFTAKDPSIMRDTATDRYFRQMAQTNQDLLDNSVVSIKLVAMEWGSVTIRGNAAVATTYETWTTTFADGKTQSSRDRNDYRLVKQSGVWKIDDDLHPSNDSLPRDARQV